MSFWSSLFEARGHIVFVTALLASSYFILEIEQNLGPDRRVKPNADASAAAPQRGWYLELGLVPTPDAAAAAWDQARSTVPELIGTPALMQDSGTAIRFQIGPMASATAARTACDRLVRAGMACTLTQASSASARR